METYKVKSITISRKRPEDKDSFKTAFIGLFDSNNPYKTDARIGTAFLKKYYNLLKP